MVEQGDPSEDGPAGVAPVSGSEIGPGGGGDGPSSADEPVSGRSRTRLLIAFGVGAAGLVLVLALVAVAVAGRSSELPLGPGTATISWVGPGGFGPASDPVSGSASGLTVTGLAKTPNNPFSSAVSSGPPTSLPTRIPIADVTGTMDGQPFTLAITLVLTQPVSAPGGTTGTANIGEVTGTFRHQPIKAALTANLGGGPIHFRGTIGKYSVTGSVDQPTRHGDTSTAHASFTVKG